MNDVVADDMTSFTGLSIGNVQVVVDMAVGVDKTPTPLLRDDLNLVAVIRSLSHIKVAGEAPVKDHAKK